MSFIAIAIGGAAVLGAGATVASGVLNSNAQKKAAASAAQSQNNANQTNYQMFQESRGSGGSAVLPLYLRTPEGGLFENQLGNDLVSAYNQSAVPLTTFTGTNAPLEKAQGGASTLTSQLFTGGVTKGMLRNAAPVQAGRISGARSSAMDALSRTLASIDATQATHGYSGTSFGNNLLRFQANKAAGDAISAANQQNLQETADIKNYGNYTLPLQNMGLPGQMAQQAGAVAFMPQQEWLQSLQQRTAPMSFIRIGGGPPFTSQPLPVAPPNSAGAAAAGAIGAFGGTAMQYYMAQQQQQNLLAQIDQMNKVNTGYYNPMTISATPGASMDASAYNSNAAPALVNSAVNGGVDWSNPAASVVTGGP